MPQLIQNGDVLSGTSNDSANILYSEPDGSSKNVQDKIKELNNSLAKRQPHIGLINPEGVTNDALSVCRFIKNNYAEAGLDLGLHFTVLAANLDWYTGEIYGDGGASWWGTVQRSGNNSENSTVYKYVNIGGADSVTPFNSGFSKLPTIVAKNSWDWGSKTRTISHTVTLPVGYEYFIVYAYSYGGQSASIPTLSGSGLLSSQVSQSTRGGTSVGLYKKNKTGTLNVTTSATMTSNNTETQDLVIIAVPLA